MLQASSALSKKDRKSFDFGGRVTAHQAHAHAGMADAFLNPVRKITAPAVWRVGSFATHGGRRHVENRADELQHMCEVFVGEAACGIVRPIEVGESRSRPACTTSFPTPRSSSAFQIPGL